MVAIGVDGLAIVVWVGVLGISRLQAFPFGRSQYANECFVFVESQCVIAFHRVVICFLLYPRSTIYFSRVRFNRQPSQLYSNLAKVGGISFQPVPSRTRGFIVRHDRVRWDTMLGT